MSEEILLINPRARRARRKNPSAAQKRARAAFAAAARARSRSANPKRRRARRRNPGIPIASVPYVTNPRRRRRRNPSLRSMVGRRIRRRSNPISVGGVMGPLKQAAVMGAGAVGMEVLYAYVDRMLPANLQSSPGQLSAGNAIKAVLTVVIGKALDRPTKGLSKQAAIGSLVVQAADIVRGLMPASLPLAGRMGYVVPGRVVPGTARVGPNRTTMGEYMRPGASALLNGPGRVGAYMTPGASALLSGNAREREGYMR